MCGKAAELEGVISWLRASVFAGQGHRQGRGLEAQQGWVWEWGGGSLQEQSRRLQGVAA